MSSTVPSTLRAIVFDFDGVVVESGDVKTDAFVELFAEHGPSVQERVRAHHLENLGVSRFKKFEWIYEHLLGRELSEASSHALGQRFSALVLDKVLAAPFVPGTLEALRDLSSRYPLFVASGTPQAELDLIVEKRGLSSFFREVHGTPREKPVILRDLLQRFSWTPDAVLFIGDGMSDYRAATNVGTAFLARDTPEIHDQWLALSVRRVVDLHELARVVDEWTPA